jgi:two-component system CheB/CheR fusion protein
MASHDLRQPLQVMLAALDLLTAQIHGGREHGYVKRAAQAAAELAGKLDLLVDAVRLGEELMDNACQPTPLSNLLEGVSVELADAARLKRIKLRVVDTNITMLSHPVLLSGILRNLLRNAIEYTPHGGRVLIGCRSRSAKAYIEVRDSGVGIPEAELTQIFTAFHRADSSRGDGLGLGLFIVKRAADLLRHPIEVRSAVGRGSCFTVMAATCSPQQCVATASEASA